jgi:hypothetical protein
LLPLQVLGRFHVQRPHCGLCQRHRCWVGCNGWRRHTADHAAPLLGKSMHTWCHPTGVAWWKDISSKQDRSQSMALVPVCSHAAYPRGWPAMLTKIWGAGAWLTLHRMFMHTERPTLPDVCCYILCCCFTGPEAECPRVHCLALGLLHPWCHLHPDWLHRPALWPGEVLLSTLLLLRQGFLCTPKPHPCLALAMTSVREKSNQATDRSKQPPALQPRQSATRSVPNVWELSR